MLLLLLSHYYYYYSHCYHYYPIITMIIPLLLLLSHCYYYYPIITIIIPVCYYYYYQIIIVIITIIIPVMLPFYPTMLQPYFIMIFAPGAVLLSPGFQWHPQRSPAAVPGDVSLRARRDGAGKPMGRCKRYGTSVAKPSKYPGKIMENYRKSWKMTEHDGEWSKLMMEHVSDVCIFHMPRIWLWTS